MANRRYNIGWEINAEKSGDLTYLNLSIFDRSNTNEDQKVRVVWNESLGEWVNGHVTFPMESDNVRDYIIKNLMANDNLTDVIEWLQGKKFPRVEYDARIQEYVEIETVTVTENGEGFISELLNQKVIAQDSAAANVLLLQKAMKSNIDLSVLSKFMASPDTINIKDAPKPEGSPLDLAVYLNASALVETLS